MIEFAKLLGLHLKDDRVIDILETYNMQVIYDFDRDHENIADIYWAHAWEAGFLLRFDENQKLRTVYLYVIADEGHEAVQRDIVDVAVYETFDDAERAFKASGNTYEQSSGEPGDFLRSEGIVSMHKLWIKVNRGRYSAHYQFANGKISRVTLQLKN
jgi:hypothetical protein